MTFIFFITNILMSFFAGVVAYYGLKNYITADYNKIDSMNWGVSFLLVCIVFLIGLISDFLPIQNFSVLAAITHLTDSFVFVLQFLVAIRLRTSIYSKFTEKQNRIIRVISLTTFVLMFSVVIPIHLYNPSTEPSTSWSIQLISSDIHLMDVVLETIHMIMALSIFLLIPAVLEYKYYKFGILLIGISEGIQLKNMLEHKYLSESCLMLEWFTAVLGVFLMSLAIYKIQRRIENGI